MFYQLGLVRDGKFERVNKDCYTLNDFLPKGRFAHGPEMSDAWVFQEDAQVLVVFKGNPPVFKRYPDLDTALVVIEIKGN